MCTSSYGLEQLAGDMASTMRLNMASGEDPARGFMADMVVSARTLARLLFEVVEDASCCRPAHAASLQRFKKATQFIEFHYSKRGE
jgi:hypothetical protein